MEKSAYIAENPTQQLRAFLMRRMIRGGIYAASIFSSTSTILQAQTEDTKNVPLQSSVTFHIVSSSKERAVNESVSHGVVLQQDWLSDIATRMDPLSGSAPIASSPSDHFSTMDQRVQLIRAEAIGPPSTPLGEEGQFDDTSAHSANPQYNSIEIGRIAARLCGPANLVVRDLNARMSPSILCQRDVELEELLKEVRLSSAERFRENAAGAAMKLHFGIFACNEAERLFRKIELELSHQKLAQSKLIDKGIAIEDPYQIDRLFNQLTDQFIANESKRKQLRIQLSKLIGGTIACSYQPICEERVEPFDTEICQYVEIASRCRQELRLLYSFKSKIQSDNIQIWDDVAALLTNTVATASSKRKLPLAQSFRKFLTQRSIEDALEKRQDWLDTLIFERKNHIQVDLEVAYEQKKSAALRWVNGMEQLKTWDARIVQLEKVGEAIRGNLEEQSKARLERLQSESALIERWLDWQIADVDLQLAVGKVAGGN